MEVNLETLLLCALLALSCYLIWKREHHPRDVPHSSMKTTASMPSRSSIISLPKPSVIAHRYNRPIRICITGGPCAGKTTALAKLAARLPELGYKVFTVPEAATLLREGGAMINMSSFKQTEKVRFQLQLVKLQLALEDIYTNLAERCGENTIVVCDRGVMDGAAYVSDRKWQALLDMMGLTKVHLRDCRYDFVIHLVTAAAGAEGHYSTKTNTARYESIEGARRIDKRLLRVWMGHPSLYIIDNDRVQTFEEKMQRCIELTCRKLGHPSSMGYSYKFLVRPDGYDLPQIPDHIPTQKIQVEETFLESEPGIIERVQRRGHSNSYTYLYTKETINRDRTRSGKSTLITSREYLKCIARRDQSRKTIERVLYCLVWGDDYLVLDTFMNVVKGLRILRIETGKREDELTFPPFINIFRNVSKDLGFSSYILAKRDYYLDAVDKGLFEAP